MIQNEDRTVNLEEYACPKLYTCTWSYLLSHRVSISSVQAKIRFLFQQAQLMLMSMENSLLITKHCCVFTISWQRIKQLMFQNSIPHHVHSFAWQLWGIIVPRIFLHLSLVLPPHLGQQSRVQNERINTCFSVILSPTFYASNLAPVLRM